MSMVVLDVLKASLKKIGQLESGRDILSVRQADALLDLQMMLRSWAQKQILVFASTKESFSLVATQASYTWGSSGNITTTRPHRLLGGFVKDSGNTDHPVKIISEREYRELSSKATSGRPDSMFLHPLFPLAYLYVYPTPDTGEVFYIDSLKPFTETSSFAAVTDEIDFPPNYEEAIVYNLAVRLAPEYEVSVSSEVVVIAKESYDSLIVLNSSNQVESIRLSLPIGNGRSSYNMNSR